METPEEAMAYSNSSDSAPNDEFVHSVVKGKRTKRQRTQPPPVLSMAVADSPSASSAEAASGTLTEEEEDMANCLILLAQGRTLDAGPNLEEQKGYSGGVVAGGSGSERFTSRRLAEAATTTNGKAGIYVYECKTCNKCFPSFQALGGHRTSHKKTKLAAGTTAEEKKLPAGDDILRISMNSFSKPIAGSGQTNTKPKVHECSICGSVFSSGQALGGHMRRHRPLGVADSQEAKKDKSFLSLDLNLPAPADDGLQRPPSPTLSLASKRPLIFRASASALVVDCHY